MKKFILLILVAFFTTTTTLAQEVSATLNHNDTLTTYYGIDALVTACKKAVSGDVITLSHGQFNPPNITDNITIIGSGMDSDTVQGVMPTIILEGTNIETAKCSFKNLRIEQIKTYYNCDINCEKVRINSHNYSTSKTTEFFLYNCIAHISRIDRIHAINSYVLIGSGSSQCDEGIYDNCILSIGSHSSGYSKYIINSTLTNCIVIDNNVQELAFKENVYLANTLYVGAEESPFKNSNVGKAWKVGSDTEIFKTGSKYYELTDEIKEKYKGIDGKELGIYGGAHTFSPNPITHHITRCDVAPKTTPDGKLSVHIEVSGAE